MTRSEHLRRLKKGEFDVCVIGGGATGSGIALDAALRGHRVGLIERGDFASGTSSKSTKLVHGGVRYLERAVLKLDRSQFHLVREALKERATLLRIAPHLVRPLPILTPLYHWLAFPYYTTGLKLYDRLSGKYRIETSRVLGKKAVLKLFPQLRVRGLKGGILYYDGQFDDAKMAIAVLKTAEKHGAVVANYVEGIAFSRENNRINRLTVRDGLTGDTWEIRAKVFVNASGPFTDSIRWMEDKSAEPMMTLSSGVHLSLDLSVGSHSHGLLIPKTRDGRVLFLLPWQGAQIAGTTDEAVGKPVFEPRSTAAERQFVLDELGQVLRTPLTPQAVRSSWSGLRPLVEPSHHRATHSVTRDHVITTGPYGLITVAGGKWTTFRKMAEDTLDRIEVERGGKRARCRTSTISLVEVGTGKGALEKVVRTAIAEQWVCRPLDFLARRMRTAFTDVSKAEELLPRVTEILAKVLDWDESMFESALEEGHQALSSNGEFQGALASAKKSASRQQKKLKS